MKKWILGLAIIGGIAMFVRGKMRSGYDEEWMDEDEPAEFGHQDAPAHEAAHAEPAEQPAEAEQEATEEATATAEGMPEPTEPAT